MQVPKSESSVLPTGAAILALVGPTAAAVELIFQCFGVHGTPFAHVALIWILAGPILLPFFVFALFRTANTSLSPIRRILLCLFIFVGAAFAGLASLLLLLLITGGAWGQ